MKNGIVTLGLFRIIDEIASQNKITDGQWAKAAGISYGSRVAELRWASKLQSEGKSPKRVGRAFTVQKLEALIKGLEKIIGGDTLRRELLKRIENADSQTQRILLMVLSLIKSKPNADQIEIFLRTMLKSRDEE